MGVRHHMCFKLIRFFYMIADFLCRTFCCYSLRMGSEGVKKRKIGKYESSGHVLEILWKSRKIELEGAEQNNFILNHVGYVHPETIFKGPDQWTLMNVDDEYAIFVACAPDVDVHSHQVGPFFYINQFNYCEKLLRLPWRYFVRLMRELRDPEDPLNIVLLSNTGRCGSTLLTQLFEKLPATAAISEPEALMPFAADRLLFTQDFDEHRHLDPEDEIPDGEKRREYLRAVIEALCASIRKQKPGVRHICIKPKAHSIGISHELVSLFPGMRHLYLFRHPLQYVTSLKSVFNSLLHPVIHSTLMRLSIKMNVETFLMSHFSNLEHPKAKQMLALIEKEDFKKNKIGLFTALYCSNMMSAQAQADELNFNFKVVSYHELIEKDKGPRIMSDVARHCRVDPGPDIELSPPDFDSQTNSGLSRQHLQNFKTDLTEEEVAEIDRILGLCGFPPCESSPIDALNMQQRVLQI